MPLRWECKFEGNVKSLFQQSNTIYTVRVHRNGVRGFGDWALGSVLKFSAQLALAIFSSVSSGAVRKHHVQHSSAQSYTVRDEMKITLY